MEIDAFDVLWDEDFPGAEKASRPIVPVGTHTMRIVSASFGTGNSPKSSHPQKNPQGKTLSVVLEVGDYSRVYADIPLHWRGIVEAVHRAARVALPGKPSDIDCSAFTGQYVNVQIEHYVGKAGDRAKVAQWLDNGPPLPAGKKQQPPRLVSTATHKLPSDFPSDDIPF